MFPSGISHRGTGQCSSHDVIEEKPLTSCLQEMTQIPYVILYIIEILMLLN